MGIYKKESLDKITLSAKTYEFVTKEFESYLKYKDAIATNEEQKKHLLEEKLAIGSPISSNTPTSKTNKISQPTENLALDLIELENEIDKNNSILKSKIKAMDEAITEAASYARTKDRKKIIGELYRSLCKDNNYPQAEIKPQTKSKYRKLAKVLLARYYGHVKDEKDAVQEFFYS